MSEGWLEVQWDLCNRGWAQVVDAILALKDQLVACHGAKPRAREATDWYKMNPYRE